MAQPVRGNHPVPGPPPGAMPPGWDPRTAEAQLIMGRQPDPTAGMPKDKYGLVKSPLKDPLAHVPVQPMSAADHVRNMQQFLKNRGYNITVDGIRGPQTNAIVAAFHKGISAKQLAAQSAKTAPQAAAASAGVKAPPVPGKPGTTKVIQPKGKIGIPDKPSQVGLAANGTDPFAVDPYAYAKSAANAQYDPQIAALQQQLGQLDPQHTQNLADLTSWINQIKGDNTQATTDTQAFDKANLAGYDQGAGNIAQLFGGAAAPDFSGFANIGRTELTGLADSQNAFQKNMGTILTAQGVDNLRSEQGRYDRNKSDLLSQLGAARTAKGQAYIADLQTGMDNAQKAAIAKQSLALAQGMQPYQIASAKAQAAAARAQAASAKADAANASATAKANLDLINARVKQAQAAANGGQWNLKDPNDRGSLAQAIRTSIGNKQGWLRVSPKIALQNVQQALAQAGLSSDPDAQAIANSVFQEVLNNSHSAKLFRNVQYVNGQLVVKPKK